HEEALEATREAVLIRRRLAEARPEAFLPELALSLHNLGDIRSYLGWREEIMLGEIGWRDEALEAVRESVLIRRRLAEARPEAFLPDLAQSLGALGAILRAHGEREPAASAFREALTLLWPLVEQTPGTHAPLARSLLKDLAIVVPAEKLEKDAEVT